MTSNTIGAVILAAGRSQRMGRPKLVLPWGNKTVIEHITTTLIQAGIEEILLVTGGAREQVEQALSAYNVKFAYNPHYETSGMITSLQIGIYSSDPTLDALLVVLGDQPVMQTEVIHLITQAFYLHRPRLVIPSYQMRRGHPWLIEKSLWEKILEMPAEATLRDFLQRYQQDILYVPVNTATILQDMDTPDDYQHLKPEG